MRSCHTSTFIPVMEVSPQSQTQIRTLQQTSCQTCRSLVKNNLSAVWTQAFFFALVILAALRGIAYEVGPTSVLPGTGGSHLRIGTGISCPSNLPQKSCRPFPTPLLEETKGVGPVAPTSLHSRFCEGDACLLGHRTCRLLHARVVCENQSRFSPFSLTYSICTGFLTPTGILI